MSADYRAVERAVRLDLLRAELAGRERQICELILLESLALDQPIAKLGDGSVWSARTGIQLRHARAIVERLGAAGLIEANWQMGQFALRPRGPGHNWTINFRV